MGTANAFVRVLLACGHVARQPSKTTNAGRTLFVNGIGIGIGAIDIPMNPSEHIDQLIGGLADWRGKTLARVRETILEADPEIVEEWKWMGSPVWSRDGIIAVGNAHKKHVKLTFANGAHVADPHKTFNNGLQGNKWRSIDFFEGDEVDAPALIHLVRAAIEYNRSKLKKPPAITRTKVDKSERA